MKEMAGQDRQNKDTMRAGRKRIAEKVICAFGLAGGVFWLLIFVAMLSTGYLSWTGIVVGVSVIGPSVLCCVAGLAGRKRLEKLLSRLESGVVILIVVAAAAVLLWPEGKGKWRPYVFEDELAAVEAERAVPTQDNAAPQYESALASTDVNDRPGFIFSGSSVRDELVHHPWKPSDHPDVSSWLDLHAATIGELLRIGKMEKCRWPVYANSDCRWTVPYERLSYGMQLLAIAGYRDLGEGRPVAALEKSLCLLRNADHLYQQTHDLDFRYAFTAERMALEILRHLLVASELSQHDILNIALRLPTSADTWRQDTARLLKFTELRFAQVMASVYEINEQGKIRFATSARCLFERAQEQEDSVLRGRAWRLYWYMNMPLDPHGVWHMAARESAALVEFLQSGPILPAARSDFDSFWRFPGKALSNLTRWHAHESCFSESIYTSFVESYAQQMTQRRGTWLVLGIRCYHDAHDAWPQTLEMIAEYVPAEAFVDPTGGGAFVYTLDGDGFTLYSKGVNRIDEGGRHRYVKTIDKLEDDISIWPPSPLPEPRDEESLKEELESIYGREYAEAHFKDKGSDKK